MTTKIAIIEASKFNPLNYHEAVRLSFEEITHRSVIYKKLFAFEQYITGFPFDYVFDTPEQLDAFIVTVPESITKVQLIRHLDYSEDSFIPAFAQLSGLNEETGENDRYNMLMSVVNTSVKYRRYWDASYNLYRNDDIVHALAYAFNMSDEDIDSLFVKANTY